ncbi:MAG: hypothetical protein IKN14_06920 [Clostridiales bacterium]|nr:hypothetical protein [Clostridiales bacterium]
MTMIAAVSGSGLDDVETLADKLGIDNPLDVETSDELKEMLALGAAGVASGYISRAREAAAKVTAHNEKIDAVVEAIDSNA